MNKQGKKDFESPPSTFISDQQPTLKQLSQQIKKFQRSRHSKSKGQMDDQNYQLFFVKNICTQYLDGKYNSRLPSNIFSPSKNQKQQYPRSKKKGSHIKVKKQSQDLYRQQRRISEENQKKQSQSKAISLRKQVLKLQEENTVLKQINERLQQKMSGISDQLQIKINQNQQLRQNIVSLELKLKQLSNSYDKTPSYSAGNINTKHTKDKMHVDKKEVKIGNTILKKQTPVSQEKSEVKSSEKEVFLEQLVQEMKRQVQKKDDHIKKLGIKLDIFMIKQAKGNPNNQVENSSEMDHLKKKYQRLIKNYADVYQQLNQFRNTKDDKDAYSPDKDLSFSL